MVAYPKLAAKACKRVIRKRVKSFSLSSTISTDYQTYIEGGEQPMN